MFDSYKEIFSQRAESYHTAMNRWVDARDDEFNAVIAYSKISDGETVCDVPSGGGYLSSYIKQTKIELHLVETSKYFYTQCPSNNSIYNHLCSLDALPFDNGSCDCLISLAGMHHIENRAPIYREFFRVLKPNGRLILADAEEHSITDRFLNEYINAANSMGHKGLFLNETDRHALSACGFNIIKDQVENLKWRFVDNYQMGSFCNLLFGADKATIEETIRGIKKYLGCTKTHGMTLMHWDLTFIKAIKK